MAAITFKLAYEGFEIGDPAVDKRLMAWAEESLEKEVPNLGNPLFDRIEGSARRLWAEALVDRYGGAPAATQWMNDPIATRLKPALTVIFQDVRRFAVEAAEKRSKKMNTDPRSPK